MFICSACARRTSNALLHRLPAAKNPLAVTSRAIATASASQRDHGTADGGMPDRNTNRPRHHQIPIRLRKAIQKELEWTRDPWHLADNVLNKIRGGEFEKALYLAREASSGAQVVVSWNHLIEHQFKQKKLHAAIKLFNEMKKRAQEPNAHTYTIIFSGLAQSDHPKLAVGEALKIYNAMLSSMRLKPNVTHLNAVLDVCAKAQDIESLFVTLRSADSIRSPNTLTYTIILNALRHQQSNTVDPSSTLSEKEQREAIKKSIDQTISRAKIVWEEVMARWRKSEVSMDEELMCAMGRILLLGGARQTEAIVTMVTEILGITKLKDGEPGLIPEGSREKAGSAIKTWKYQWENIKETGGERGSESGTADAISSGLVQQQPVQPQVTRFAANNTLSLLMRAFANSKLTKLGARYWDYMTTIYAVLPDRKNYRDYLDCLFTGAASGKAARVIASMPQDIVEAQAIRRGLLMCYFDTFNTKAFDNANSMLDAMTRKMRYPDPRCLTMYLEVALKARHKFSDVTKYHSQEERNLAYGMQLFEAISRIWELLRLATNHLGFEDGPMSAASPQESSLRSYPGRRALIETAETAQAVCDKMLSQRLLPVRSEEHNITVARRHVLNKCVTRWHQQTEHPGRAKGA